MESLPCSETSVLAKRVLRCIRKLDKFLVPPFYAFLGEEFAAAIQQETGAEAVSIFLIDRDSPNELRWAGAVGYRPECQGERYFLQGPFLTSYVCREGTAINFGRTKLEELAQKHEFPYSGRCQELIATGRFINLIAVPIIFGETQSNLLGHKRSKDAPQALGVLKLENLGDNPKNAFPDDVFSFASVMSAIIGLSYQQGLYAQLWKEVEHAGADARSAESYLQMVAEILSQRLPAECTSFFLKSTTEDRGSVLKYIAGVGYKDGYTSHQYPLLPPDSFTATIATRQKLRKFTVEALQNSKEFPFRGACSSFIKSGSFRNILALPLLRGETDCIGVLKIENRIPEHTMFDHHDETVCQAFVEQLIVPTLARLTTDGGTIQTKGFEALKAACLDTSHSSRKLDKSAVRDMAKRVWAAQQKDHTITTADCCNYLQVSKATYYRLLKLSGLRREIEIDNEGSGTRR